MPNNKQTQAAGPKCLRRISIATELMKKKNQLPIVFDPKNSRKFSINEEYFQCEECCERVDFLNKKFVLIDEQVFCQKCYTKREILIGERKCNKCLEVGIF